ncbi:hypothetical protein QQG55_43075 [Brugia pahangi]
MSYSRQVQLSKVAHTVSKNSLRKRQIGSIRKQQITKWNFTILLPIYKVYNCRILLVKEFSLTTCSLASVSTPQSPHLPSVGNEHVDI